MSETTPSSEFSKLLELRQAREIAIKAHDADIDLVDGLPYVLHPLRVSAVLEPISIDAAVVAALHDVLEKTKYTTDDLLRLGIHPERIHQLVALSRTYNEAEDSLTQRAIDSGDEDVQLVRLADALDKCNIYRLERIEDEAERDYLSRKQEKRVSLLIGALPFLAKHEAAIRSELKIQYCVDVLERTRKLKRLRSER